MKANTPIARTGTRSLSLVLVLLNLHFGVISLGLISCNQTKDKLKTIVQGNPTPDTLDRKIVVTDSSFLALFPGISGKIIHVYSPTVDATGAKFSGQKIDPAFYKYFSADTSLKRSLEQDYSIFSCFKVKLSDKIIGLIVRIPGMYSETALALFLWDKQESKIIGNFELADQSGDGEWYFVKDAWLIDVNKDKQIDVVTRRKDWWREDVEGGIGASHVADSIKVYASKGITFSKTELSVDTAQFQLFDWKN